MGAVEVIHTRRKFCGGGGLNFVSLYRPIRAPHTETSAGVHVCGACLVAAGCFSRLFYRIVQFGAFWSAVSHNHELANFLNYHVYINLLK